MKEKILILVRAIPEFSKKHGYLICVAGINEKGEWRRLYPFKFNSIGFKKKSWIISNLSKNQKDKRPESRKVENYEVLDKSANNIEVVKILNPLTSSIGEMKSKKRSLCVVKPELIDVIVKVHNLKIIDEQTYLNFYGGVPLKKREKVKMPVEVQYIFKCKGRKCSCSKKPHKIKIIDFEINELFRNIVKGGTTDKSKVIEKIKNRLLNFMKKRELFFIMGTHFRYATPIIIGLFYPKKSIASQKSISEC